MITPRQKRIMQHALGLDNSKIAYRNRYFAGPDSENYSNCVELCRIGFMHHSEEIPDLFTVTDQGEHWLMHCRG